MSSTIAPMNAYQSLRAEVMATSTRDYKARGILAIRCTRCQLKSSHCICTFRPEGQIDAEFVLILHRDELFKPTNTGRLIADCFPKQTHAFCWDRLTPPQALLTLLQDPERQCCIIFPADESEGREVYSEPPASNKLLTFILLDGTWKQGRRMFNLSPWLQTIPALNLDPAERARYSSRIAAFDNYLCTAEAAALALAISNQLASSQLLFDYFSVFNLHYAAMRQNRAVDSFTL
ncbi:DTW domain-containing protein [Simiduia curdlanivorans]|uniref:tRNA-uridine aminocarboxypropyltransferase n=1 Tax=Simiduia curdlanivorans TaxID=1492769 RepID=A0ABV8UZS1_9GAMM|nr:DTW domain-containing protein [Simiduia curdlanivorans]MDN3638087.1 DTW domain-containing protein [Simiduia curdlanivorans]